MKSSYFPAKFVIWIMLWMILVRNMIWAIGHSNVFELLVVNSVLKIFISFFLILVVAIILVIFVTKLSGKLLCVNHELVQDLSEHPVHQGFRNVIKLRIRFLPSHVSRFVWSKVLEEVEKELDILGN